MMDARSLHADALVWDQTFPAVAFCGSRKAHIAALGRMRESGYSVVSLTAGIDGENAANALSALSFWRHFLRGHPDKYVLLETADDAVAAKAQGKLAVGFHFQGTVPFERDLGLVEVFYKLGVRHALMAYNQKNHVGDGCHERTDAGLSRYGIDVVMEMNRVGMLVDCTHTGYRTSLDVFEVSKSPVIFSHSNAAALRAHQRNIPDELARACARTGGVVGVNGIGIFLGDNDSSTEALFRHVDHWVQLIGAEHVGIGLDSVSDPDMLTNFVHEEAAKYPSGQGYEVSLKVSIPEQVPELTELMQRAGYPEIAIRGVLGENWLRLARTVWK